MAAAMAAKDFILQRWDNVLLLPHKGTIAMFAAKRRVLLRCVGIPLTPTLNGAREKDRLLNYDIRC